jgi:hypothetical protein
MLRLPKIEFDFGKLPGGQKGIKYHGIKIILSIKNLLDMFKNNGRVIKSS